jgi:hypothetical protein
MGSYCRPFSQIIEKRSTKMNTTAIVAYGLVAFIVGILMGVYEK